jgi:hypothetical protein
MGQAEIALLEADRLQAQANVYREEGRWNDARQSYEDARRSLVKAAEFAVRSGLPQAQVMQEGFMAMASAMVGSNVRTLRAEQRLTDEMEQLRAERREFVDNLRSGGVTVNSYADARAVAEQSTQVVMQVEHSVRTMLGNLAVALQSGSLGAEGEVLLDDVTALQTAQDTGVSFLERAKQLTTRVATAVRNAGDTAAPVIEVLRVLGPLVGIHLGAG